MNKNTPFFTFLSIAQLVLAYLITIFSSVLYINFIKLLLPDSINDTYYTVQSIADIIRFSIAVLIVAVPLLIVVARTLGNYYRSNHDIAESNLKKWLGYLTLFVTGATISITIISVVWALLSGDLLMRFVWEAFSVIVISGVLFMYYYSDVKKTSYESTKISKVLGYALVVVFLIPTISMFFTDASPAKLRLIKADNNTSSVVVSTVSAVSNYYYNNAKLPEDKSKLRVSNYVKIDKPVEYTKKSETEFEICAEFNLNADGINQRETYYSSSEPFIEENNYYEHSAGRNCYGLTINQKYFENPKNYDKPFVITQ